MAEGVSQRDGGISPIKQIGPHPHGAEDGRALSRKDAGPTVDRGARDYPALGVEEAGEKPMTRLRKIRIFRCATCKTVVHDHGLEKSRMLESHVCPKCRKPMTYEEGMYAVTVPDAKKPWHRVARRLEA